jgi:hypothetical protein
MAVSPMSLAIARRSWQEAMMGCLGLLFVFICCEITRRPKRLVLYAAGVALGSYLLLVKLSGWVIYALCMAWMLWILVIKERSILKGLALIALSVAGAAAMFALLLHLAGGFDAVRELVMHKRSAMASNAYAIEYCSGIWYRFINMLWILSPVSTVLFGIGICSLLYDKKRQEAVLGIALFLAAFMAMLFIFKRYPQNLRYISALYVPFYLIGGMGFCRSMSFITKKVRGASLSIVVICAVSALVFGAVNEYGNYRRVIADTGIKDLSIKLIEEADAGLYNR